MSEDYDPAIFEEAQRIADEKYPRPKILDSVAAMYGAIAGASVITVFMALAGLAQEYFGMPLMICVVISGAIPYFYIRHLNNKNHTEFARQLARTRGEIK